VIVGLRSRDRGENFRAYINFGGIKANEQNPQGILAWRVTGASSSEIDSRAPTGEKIWYEPHAHAPDTWATRATVHFFGRETIQEYYGRYRVWVRATQTGGDLVNNYIEVRLAKSMPASDPIVISETRRFGIEGAAGIQALDMGEISLPISGMPVEILPESWFGDKLLVQAQAVGIWGANDGLSLYDICLMPVDEWVAEFYDPSDFSGSGWLFFDSSLGRSETNLQRYIDIDSITSPKDHLVGTVQGVLPGLTRGTAAWRVIANGEAILHPNKGQRIHLFAERFPARDITSYFYNQPYHGYSVQAFRSARYLGGRGAD